MIHKLLDSKLFYMITSVLVAIFLWVYVDTGTYVLITETYTNIPVVFDGEETLENRGLMIVHDPSKETVTLRLQGKRSVLANLDKDNIVITVKTSQIVSAGEQSLDYTISYPPNVLAGSVEVISKSKNSITVQVVAEGTTTVPVRAEFIGSIAKDHYGGEIVCATDLITLTGRQELVNTISYALITVDGKNLTESISADYPYQLYDVNGEVIDLTEITCTPETVAVSMRIEPMKEVDLDVTLIEGGGATTADVTYEIEPKSIIIAGEKALLDTIEKINLGSIDLAEVLVSPEEIQMNIPLGDGISSKSGETTARVTIKIRSNLETRALDVSNILVLNAPDGYSVQRMTQNLPVTIRGPKASVESITSENVTIYVDLSTLNLSAGSTGTITVPAKITFTGYSDVGAVGDYSVVLTIE